MTSTNFVGDIAAFCWPSGLRRCSKNRKVPSSNPTRHLAGLRDPTSLWGSWWPSGRKCKTQWLTSDEWGYPLAMAQSWPWGSQIAVKIYIYIYEARIFHFSIFNVSHKSLSFITWNLIEYLYTQDFQRATPHLNFWTNILLFCFVYVCT